MIGQLNNRTMCLSVSHDIRINFYQFLIYHLISCHDWSSNTGYAHSALNPILYWALNHNSLRQSSFLSRLSTVQRFLRTRLRDHNHQPPPSSTNEAALGPFNPRYIKARPQPQYHAPPASSHYLYWTTTELLLNNNDTSVACWHTRTNVKQ